MADVEGPLSGIRVLDLSIMMAGPYCTRFLADMGADVIKVEPPEGDLVRVRTPLREGQSTLFGHLNSGKRSVVLDLKKPAAVEAVKALAAECDVFVENFRPGVIQRLGLDYETLKQINPGIVYCSVSGFGQTGPSAKQPAYAQVIHAMSGYDIALASYQGPDAKPVNTGIFVADVLGSSFALSGILAALLNRQRTGEGAMVDTALLDCMMCVMPHQVQEAQVQEPSKRPVYEPIRTADGYVMITAVSAKNFETLLDAIGSDWRETAPELHLQAAAHKNWSIVMSKVQDWTATRSTAECERILSEAGVPTAAYRTVAEALREPQFAHRGSLAEVQDAAGTFLVPNLPYRMPGLRVEVANWVPRLGEHSREVLRDAAGLSEAAIDAAIGKAGGGEA